MFLQSTGVVTGMDFKHDSEARPSIALKSKPNLSVKARFKIKKIRKWVFVLNVAGRVIF